MKTQSLEELRERMEERAKELVAYAEELIKHFPEITLRGWFPAYRLSSGQWQAGVDLDLTGPEVAVKAYLSSLGIARNLDRIQIIQGIDPATGRTFATPVKGFTAILTLCRIDEL